MRFSSLFNVVRFTLLPIPPMFFWDFYFFLFLIKVCARLLFLDQISGTPFSASNKSDRALFVVSL